MDALECTGALVLALLGVLLALYGRRAAVVRAGGTIEMNLRLSTMAAGRGWSHGVARFTGDELRWYRVFSLSPRPRRVLSRRDLSVLSRRAPDSRERYAMPADWVVVCCRGSGAQVEIAMAEATLTGFLSWCEAGPPGGASHR